MFWASLLITRAAGSFRKVVLVLYIKRCVLRIGSEVPLAALPCGNISLTCCSSSLIEAFVRPSFTCLEKPTMARFQLVAAAFAAGYASAASVSCSGDGPLSCHNSTAVDTCCFNYPGGQLLQTQFWDTDPATGPSDSWTLHGLWYVCRFFSPPISLFILLIGRSPS